MSGHHEGMAGLLFLIKCSRFAGFQRIQHNSDQQGFQKILKALKCLTFFCILADRSQILTLR